MPRYATEAVTFGTNQVVLAYSDASRYAAEVNSDNWGDILLRPDVKIARGDENLNPIGYQTLLVWELAGILRNDPEFADKLNAKVPPNLLRPTVNALVPLLGTEADYAFVWKSVAHCHNLQHIELGPKLSLSDPAEERFYAQAETSYLSAGPGSRRIIVRGAPIMFGYVVPTNAPNPEGGRAFAALLTGPEGQEALTARGFGFLPPTAKASAGQAAWPPVARGPVPRWAVGRGFHAPPGLARGGTRALQKGPWAPRFGVRLAALAQSHRTQPPSKEH